MLKHKLLQAMKESDDKPPISGIIQLGDVYWGSERRGGKRGCGTARHLCGGSVPEEGKKSNQNVDDGG